MKRLIIILFTCFSVSAAYALSLDSCQAMAKRNYPLVKQYGIIEKLEKVNVSSALRAWIPQLGFMAEAAYNSDVPALPQEFSDIINEFYEFKGLSKDQYKVALQLNQQIWDGGVASANKKIAKAEAEVNKLTVEKEMESLAKQVNGIYFTILMLESQRQTLNYADTLLQGTLANVESCVGNGVALQSDLDNVALEMLDLEQKKIELDHSVAAARQILSIMTGEDMASVELEVPEIPDVDYSVNNRAELRLFDAKVAQAEARKGLVNASVIPQLGLYAQGFWGRPGLNLFDDMIYDEFSWNYIVGVRLQWNISGFYNYRNNMDKIDFAVQSAEVERDAFKFGSDMETAKIRQEIEKMRKLRESDDKIVALRQSVRKASESKYANGVITINDLLRDITNENNAVATRTYRQLQLIKNIYDLKATLNQ